MPDTFPGSPGDPHWQTIRALYFYDPVLALFGELDDNILTEKNRAA